MMSGIYLALNGPVKEQWFYHRDSERLQVPVSERMSYDDKGDVPYHIVIYRLVKFRLSPNHMLRFWVTSESTPTEINKLVYDRISTRFNGSVE